MNHKHAFVVNAIVVFRLLAATILVWMIPLAALARTPPGHPAQYHDTIATRQEGKVAVNDRYAQALSCAAEIDDPLDRGKNMDTRTPQADIRVVA